MAQSTILGIIILFFGVCTYVHAMNTTPAIPGYIRLKIKNESVARIFMVVNVLMRRHKKYAAFIIDPRESKSLLTVPGDYHISAVPITATPVERKWFFKLSQDARFELELFQGIMQDFVRLFLSNRAHVRMLYPHLLVK